MRRLLSSLFLCAAAVWPCGPYFPNRLLPDGDASLFPAPFAAFEREVARIAKRMPEPAEFEHVHAEDHPAWDTAEIAVDQLAAALPRGAESDALVARVRNLRIAMGRYASSLEFVRARKGQDVAPDDEPPVMVVPAGLPAEFDFYLRGAAAYYRCARGDARRHFEKLLLLPAPQRAHRSVWAAFMLGRLLAREDPDRAVAAFRRVRELARGGAADPLGLAAAAIGREAQVELGRRRYAEALALYFEHWRAGAPTALPSLRTSIAFALDEGGEALIRVARATPARDLVTASLLSSHRGRSFDRSVPARPADARTQWLSALERTRGRSVASADRVALVAYQAGEIQLTARWLARAPADASLTIWLRAKLALRAGNAAKGARLLHLLARRFPEHDRWEKLEGIVDYASVSGDLGLLHLARRQYAESLALLLSGGHWLDAAYVAERVLTPEELVRFVRARWVRVAADPGVSRDLANLCGRRLARLGRHDDAREFLPNPQRKWLAAFAQEMQRGRNPQRDRGQRGESLWRASTIARERGMALFGTEAEPDWFVFGGNYELRATSRMRRDRVFHEQTLTRPSEHEKARLRRHVVATEQRWHYRYTAADIAWEALALMPEHDEETARRFCVVGGWLKDRDPQAADRFYKALVVRCRKTELGRRADKLRWFPELAPTPGK
ncbi:MAG: hypothetical protein V3T86_14170 [Planctomycetota bacterium]